MKIQLAKPTCQPTNHTPLVSICSKVRYLLGLMNLMAAPLLELDADEDVFTEIATGGWHQRVDDLTRADFRDPAAGWVVNGVAAPFVRILEVRDPTPEELAAAEAE